uniref:Uncharacterized protein n=1 Tax=Candidatus Kentrum sp. FW TaxID=2126338 RepID=A0A450TPC6_9GAMM|nr:MAG: hypothetical protein BECKFW1821C_GA0114237_10206 [Candidatus Kentron sp. FW]
MPFLVNLMAKERRTILKTGPDSVSFVQNALSAAQDYPDILPASSKTDELRRDMDLFAVLTEIRAMAESVMSQVDDTRLAVGGRLCAKRPRSTIMSRPPPRLPAGPETHRRPTGQALEGATKQKKHVDPLAQPNRNRIR